MKYSALKVQKFLLLVVTLKKPEVSLYLSFTVLKGIAAPFSYKVKLFALSLEVSCSICCRPLCFFPFLLWDFQTFLADEVLLYMLPCCTCVRANPACMQLVFQSAAGAVVILARHSCISLVPGEYAGKSLPMGEKVSFLEGHKAVTNYN